MTNLSSSSSRTPVSPQLSAAPAGVNAGVAPFRRIRRAGRRERLLHAAPAAAAVMVVLGALLTGAARRPDSALAWREAERALERAMAPGERMLVGTRVVRRHWGDHFRATHGVLVATDRRLLYVGILPPPLLGEVSGPPLMERAVFAFDTSLSVREGFTAGPGGFRAIVRQGEVTTRFIVAPAARDRVGAIASIAARARESELKYASRERFLQDSIASLPPPPPMIHVIRPGDTVIGLAARYGYTPEELMERNGLTNDRLRAGETLVVRQFRRVAGVVEGY